MAEFIENPPVSAPQPPIDPDPVEWFTQQRLEQLERDLLAARQTLAIAGLLPRAVDLWIRQQVASEVSWTHEDRQLIVAARESKWRASRDLASTGLLDSEVSFKLSVAPGCQKWAEDRWGHRLENLFLQQKDHLDMASCRLLRVIDKGLALELYHRIKANEESFATVARRFGEGPENRKDGLIPLQPLASMPMGLGQVLPKLEIGQLMPPSRLGKHVAIVQLEQFKPARFDSFSKQRLLAAEFDSWVENAGVLALAHLRCPHRIDSVLP